MIFAILFAVAIFLVCIFVLSRMMERMKTVMAGIDEAAPIPPTMGSVLLASVLALNIFAYDKEFGIGCGIFGATLIACIVYSFPAQKRTKEVWFFGIVGITASLLFGFRANEFVQAVNVATALICIGKLLLVRSIENIKWSALWILKMKLGFIVHLLFHPFALRSKLKSGTLSKNGKLLTALKTIGLTLIVLLFFSWLLSSADLVFDQLIREVREQALGRTILSGFLVIGLLGFMTVKISKQWQEKTPEFSILGFVEVFFPALALVALFALFLGIQAKYLFASHAEFQELGITYSDYVRKGFIELLVTSFFASLLSYVLILKQRTLKDAGNILKLKWLNSALLIELLLLLVSAGKRDWMYIETYGLTRVRLIGGIFLVWLLVIIALVFLLNVSAKMSERRFFYGAALMSALVVVSLNAMNIDDIVAFARPPAGERPDVVYMSMLSADTIEGWLSALGEASSRYELLRGKKTFTEEEKMQLADTKIALILLESRFEELMTERMWQEWNWSFAHAKRRAYEAGINPLDKILCVRAGIRTLQGFTKTDLFTQEDYRMNAYDAPFIFSNNVYWPESLELIHTLPIESPETFVPPSCETA
ncbi:MAG: hypothetical protein RIQ56_991 [Candidatus Parcubacteria bacterium]|jgi:hypothetical protein